MKFRPYDHQKDLPAMERIWHEVGWLDDSESDKKSMAAFMSVTRALVAETHLPACEPVRFNAVITDPIAEFLPDDAPWRGIGGEYVVTLGANSAAERGNDPALPTLTASAGALARLWLGVRSASGLAVTDELSAPPKLLAALDGVLRLPVPHFEWEF